MRTKQLFPGLNNSTKIRVFITQPDVPNAMEFGFETTPRDAVMNSRSVDLGAALSSALSSFAVDISSKIGIVGGVYMVNVYDSKMNSRRLNVQVDMV